MTQYNPDRQHRRSIRWRDYDYAQGGAYLVTICAYQRECLFGAITPDGEMALNEYGEIVAACWNAIPAHFPNVDLDAWVIMPNHLHGIIVIVDDPPVVGATHAPRLPVVGATHASPLPGSPVPGSPVPGLPVPASPGSASNTHSGQPWGPKHGSLGAIVGSFKSAASKQINILRDTPGAPVWLRNYYETVIRNAGMLDSRRRYIETNPARWTMDENYPANIK